MEQLEVPAKFGYFWTITGDVQCVRRMFNRQMEDGLCGNEVGGY